MENNQLNKPILIKDLGMRYPTKTSKQKRRYGNFLCKCNNEFEAQIYLVKSNHTNSCGCLNTELLKKRSITHGLSKHPLHSRWLDMKRRCSNKKRKAFKNYGGRGIKVCDEWQKNFETFYDWAISHGYKKELSLDRIDNDKGYFPSNCRFTDSYTQLSNRQLLQKNNTSGYRGVTKRDDTGIWRVQINVSNKNIQLGNYKCEIEGAKAYDRYIEENNLEHPKNFND